MESQPQNPEFRINSEDFHPCEAFEMYTCIRKYYGNWSICSIGAFSIYHNIFKSNQNFT